MSALGLMVAVGCGALAGAALAVLASRGWIAAERRRTERRSWQAARLYYERRGL